MARKLQRKLAWESDSISLSTNSTSGNCCGGTRWRGHQRPSTMPPAIRQRWVAVVGPERHVALGMMQRVQFSPVQPMLQPVPPVLRKVEHHHVKQQAERRIARQPRPEVFQRPRGIAMQARAGFQRAQQQQKRRRR